MTKTFPEISADLKRMLKDSYGVHPDRILATTLFDDLGLDSLDGVELVMMCEEHFGVEISDEDHMAINTFGEAVNFLYERINGHSTDVAAVEEKPSWPNEEMEAYGAQLAQEELERRAEQYDILCRYIDEKTGLGWRDLNIDPVDIVKCWAEKRPLNSLV